MNLHLNIVLYYFTATALFEISFLTVGVVSELNEDAEYWRNLARAELDEALTVKLNTRRAKNVILFVGDGMGPNTVTATRIYKHGESGHLSFEKFPHVGLLKTYSNNKQVPDSACTATALFTGVKVNFETAGVDASVSLNDCEGTLKEEARLKSLAIMAKEAGMSTGFVTTMRVTHATPSALYAYTANRRWECESKLPKGAEKCKDIARQLVEDSPGRDINVIMGGGRQCMVFNATSHPGDPIDTWACTRKDGRNLIQSWVHDKTERGLKYAVAQNNKDLMDIKIDTTDYLLGIFANGHMQMEHERDSSNEGMPSITNMTEMAIKILKKNDNGFFLMVEGGNIDMAHHRGKAKKAINEAATMDEAVKKAMELTNPSDTLIIVTSDHSHTLSINGYAKRGANIFGIATASKLDSRNYTTLTYSTGGPDAFQYTAVVGKDGNYTVERRDPSLDDVTDYDYVSQSAILTDENTHGGNDVIVYAKGPFSHLFHNIHEQHYVTHVISYSAGIGDFKTLRKISNNHSEQDRASVIIIFLTLLFSSII